MMLTKTTASSFLWTLTALFMALILFSEPGEVLARDGDAGKTARAITILHPREGALVDRELTHLVAKVKGDSIAFVVVKVNEHITPLIDMTTDIYRDVLRDMLIVRLYLLPGINDVEVVGQDKNGNTVDSIQMRLYYASAFDNQTSLIPADFTEKPFHSAEREKPCRDCHRMDVNPAVDLHPAKKSDILCVSCHDADMQRKFMHGAATWECLACHDHEGTPRYALKDEEGFFCLQCHNIIDEVDPSAEIITLHAPVKERRCLVCHNEHSAVEEPLLKNTVNKICYLCHENKFTGTHITPGHPVWAQKDPSREGKNLNCVSCHNPMYSSREKLLKYKPGMSMCQACHVK